MGLRPVPLLALRGGATAVDTPDVYAKAWRWPASS
jgi:hypothetical protein